MTRRFHATAALWLWLGGVATGCEAMSADELDEALELDTEGEEPSVATALTSAARVVGSAADDELLVRQWLQWSLAQPWSTGPVSATSTSCGSTQGSGPWFLAGTAGGSATRECTIPADTELFFPLLNGWAIVPAELLEGEEPLQDAFPAAFEAIGDQHADTCALTLRIDGQDVAAGFEQLHEDFHVEILEPFEVDVNSDDPVSGSPQGGGPVHAVTAGYYVHLAPLSPGDHVLELGGALCSGPKTFETSVTYTVHIAR
ncbi:MAG: hypothetical protein KDK70_38075 [Myxococcales bacterium]|nr:hypothetical protein [Myxococcales bacterium]